MITHKIIFEVYVQCNDQACESGLDCMLNLKPAFEISNAYIVF